MAKFPDLGTLVDLAEAEIATTYVEGRPFQAGRGDLRCQVDIAAAVDSAMGAVVVKLQSSRDGVAKWCDVASTRDDSASEELEHSFNVVPGQRVAYSITAKTRGLLNTRWLIRATSDAGIAGDEIVVSGVAM